MRVEEIALRQEVRQMLTEARINKTSIREITEQVLKEEVEKQIKNILNQTNMDSVIRSKISSFEFIDLLRNVIKQEVTEAIDIRVSVKADIKR